MRPTCGNSGGDCIHHASTITVSDTGRGPGVDSLGDPKPGHPVGVHWTSQSAPNGTESASPMFWIDDREYSVDQALALCKAVAHAVATYRRAGGAA
jgi:hypothetical protein